MAALTEDWVEIPRSNTTYISETRKNCSNQGVGQGAGVRLGAIPATFNSGSGSNEGLKVDNMHIYIVASSQVDAHWIHRRVTGSFLLARV